MRFTPDFAPTNIRRPKRNERTSLPAPSTTCAMIAPIGPARRTGRWKRWPPPWDTSRSRGSAPCRILWQFGPDYSSERDSARIPSQSESSLEKPLLLLQVACSQDSPPNHRSLAFFVCGYSTEPSLVHQALFINASPAMICFTK